MKQEEEKPPIPERVNLKRYGHFVTKREEGKHRIDLSPMELESFQSELLITHSEIKAVNAELALVKKKAAAKLAEIKKKQDRAIAALDLKYEEREGLRLTIIFMEERRAGIYDEEGRLLTHRPLSPTELQTDLYVETSMMEARQISSSSAQNVKIEKVPDHFQDADDQDVQSVEDDDDVNGFDDNSIPKPVSQDPFA